MYLAGLPAHSCPDGMNVSTGNTDPGAIITFLSITHPINVNG